MTHPYVILDVFTSRPLEGNQLAVFPEDPGLSDEAMQRTARELNLSETAFLAAGSGDADARVRIFTPTTELPFAGHPVLGAAFVLAERLNTETVCLQTNAGVVAVRLTREDGRIVFGEMKQPVPRIDRFAQTDALLEALGVERPELPVEAYRNGPLHVYVMLESERAVAELTPDLRTLQLLGAFGVSCFAGAGTRYKTRMFGPGLGVAEDPATGSAAGPLAAHLARHGRIRFGEQIELRQGEEIKRPSLLYARVEGSPERIEAVFVGGAAVTVARGEYRLA